MHKLTAPLQLSYPAGSDSSTQAAPSPPALTSNPAPPVTPSPPNAGSPPPAAESPPPTPASPPPAQSQPSQVTTIHYLKATCFASTKLLETLFVTHLQFALWSWFELSVAHMYVSCAAQAGPTPPPPSLPANLNACSTCFDAETPLFSCSQQARAASYSLHSKALSYASLRSTLSKGSSAGVAKCNSRLPAGAFNSFYLSFLDPCQGSD